MTSQLPGGSEDEAWGTDGVAHLRTLARAPRAAGSTQEREARAYCTGVLRDLGFECSIEPFSSSAFPGRYGTPVAGAIATASVLVAFWLATIEGAPRAAAIAFGAGLALLVLFVWTLLGDGVL